MAPLPPALLPLCQSLHSLHPLCLSGFYHFLVLFSLHLNSVQNSPEEPGIDLIIRKWEVAGGGKIKRGIYAILCSSFVDVCEPGQAGKHSYCISRRGFASALIPSLFFLLPFDHPGLLKTLTLWGFPTFLFADQGVKILA